jgi:23S rRNA (pseudouridine1915-N3)-methyltransferase
VRVTVVAVGKLKEPHFRDAAAEYLKRLSGYGTFEVVEVPDQDVNVDEARAVAREGEALLAAIPDGARVIALDDRGRERTSEGLSAWFEDLMVGGTSHVAFAIGGTAGLDGSVLARADERLSLSRMTLPHQLARVVLLEQVYRAFRIMRGEPYHR